MWRTHRAFRTDTGVSCPDCDTGTLTVRYSCLRTRFSCSQCGREQSLGRLLNRISDEDFERLATMVQDRLSDRI